MKNEIKKLYLNMAYKVSKLSYCKRLQVGCVIVAGDTIVFGYNGTPPGWDNQCEDDNGITKREVIHAEANAIAKLAKGSGNGKDASVFITHAPCNECAKQLATMEVKEVYYINNYRTQDGVQHLEQCGIPVYQLQEQLNEQQIKENNKCWICQTVRSKIKTMAVRLLRWTIRAM